MYITIAFIAGLAIGWIAKRNLTRAGFVILLCLCCSSLSAKDYYEGFYEAANRSGTIYSLKPVYASNLKAARKQFTAENPKRKHHGRLVVRKSDHQNTRSAKTEQRDYYETLSKDGRDGDLTDAEYKYLRDHMPTGDGLRGFTWREWEAMDRE